MASVVEVRVRNESRARDEMHGEVVRAQRDAQELGKISLTQNMHEIVFGRKLQSEVIPNLFDAIPITDERLGKI